MRNNDWQIVEEISAEFLGDVLKKNWQIYKDSIAIKDLIFDNIQLDVSYNPFSINPESDGCNLILDMPVAMLSYGDGGGFNIFDNPGVLNIQFNINTKKVSVDVSELQIPKSYKGVVGIMLSDYYKDNIYSLFVIFHNLKVFEINKYSLDMFPVKDNFIVNTSSGKLFLIRCHGCFKADRPSFDSFDFKEDYICWLGHDFIREYVILPYLGSFLQCFNHSDLQRCNEGEYIFVDNYYYMNPINVGIDRYVPKLEGKKCNIRMYPSYIAVYLSGNVQVGCNAEEDFSVNLKISVEKNGDDVVFSVDEDLNTEKSVPWYLYLSIGGGIAAEVVLSEANDKMIKVWNNVVKFTSNDYVVASGFNIDRCILNYELGFALSRK